MRVAFRRHGEPLHLSLSRRMSIEQLLRQYEDGTLDSLGITTEGADALRLTASTVVWRPGIILTSPLRRAVESAKIWSEVLEVPVHPALAPLRELRPPVDMIRQVIDEIGGMADIRRVMNAAMRVWLSQEQVSAIVADALSAIREVQEECLVISHGWLMRAVESGADLESLLRHPGYEFNKGFDLEL